ncbi:MAG TPA: peptidoglycan DD-metalloendopeptidase family protein [Gammaproteobacteria bacterium]|nr:peptidoglycan DD-metalloendopeptidase family protein [Gammaproteobacteria bacterium]
MRGDVLPGARAGFAARVFLSIAAAGVCSLVPFAAAQNPRAEQQRLQAVRKEIKAVEQQLSRQITERDESARALRTAETGIAAAARKLDGLRAGLRGAEREQRTLADRTAAASRRLSAEREELARQVRAAYMSGRQELLKVLLSQDSPATVGRMLVYYDYFNRARGARIAAIAAEMRGLAELRAASETAQRELAELTRAQAEQVATLEHARDERRAIVAKLDAGIADANAAMAKLKTEEKRLGDLVKRLAEATAGFPVDSSQPFARSKGKLAWPIAGRLAGDYGQLRGGGPVKWNGVLVEADGGTPVRAIYGGRVAFADWLPGLGLLVIVDHGGGYMSLYGHNQSLLTEPGNTVAAGEAIAEVGDSGGQSRPALYFEIRHNGEPVDPHQWITRPLPAR